MRKTQCAPLSHVALDISGRKLLSIIGCRNKACKGGRQGPGGARRESPAPPTPSRTPRPQSAPTTPRQAAARLRPAGRNPTPADIKKIMAEFDRDGTGAISFDEFVRMLEVMGPGVTEEVALAAFREFDENGDCKISTAELQRVMCEMGDPLSQEELAELMEDVDVDNDGVINYEEFVRMMLRHDEDGGGGGGGGGDE